MARPEPIILDRAEDEKGVVWEITQAETTYIILYKKRPIGIRSITPILGGIAKKYYKMTYLHEGSARAAVRRLNKRFNCDDFSYTEYGV